MTRYGMKTRHIKKRYSEHKKLKEVVPIRRFDNHLNLIMDSEKIAEEFNVKYVIVIKRVTGGMAYVE